MNLKTIFNISAALLLAVMFAFGVSGLVQFFQDLLLQDLSGQVGARSVGESVTVDPILLPFINSMQNELLSERPKFEGMLDLEDLRPGMIVLEHMANSDPIVTVIVTTPYIQHGKCRYDAIWTRQGQPIRFNNFYCSDAGLVEYTGLLHGWNPTNHLTWTGQPDLSQEEIKALLKLLELPKPIYDFGDQDL